MELVVRAWDLRPRRVHQRLAKTPPAVLPSTLLRASAPRTIGISRLNNPARTPPVNASLRPHGTPTHDSGPPQIATPFDVEHSHLLLHAGLSRRFPTTTRSTASRSKPRRETRPSRSSSTSSTYSSTCGRPHGPSTPKATPPPRHGCANTPQRSSPAAPPASPARSDAPPPTRAWTPPDARAPTPA